MADHPLWVLITTTAFGSGILVCVAGLALLRRRTWSYLFIAIAIGMLTFRAVVGFLSLTSFVTVETHHMLEHVLDVFAILLLFAAIYFARTVEPRMQDVELREQTGSS